MTAAFHRSYVHAQKRAGQVTRLHIVRETAVRRQGTPGVDWVQAECSVSASPCTRSQPVFIDPMPTEPPDGLSWCPTCVGWLAYRRGLLTEVAASLAGTVVTP